MSLKIEKVPADTGITVALAGRLDTSTAPELEAELEKLLPAAAALTFDLANLEYISSAGLRVILKTQKEMSRKGGKRLIQVPETVMELKDNTAKEHFLTIET